MQFCVLQRCQVSSAACVPAPNGLDRVIYVWGEGLRVRGFWGAESLVLNVGLGERISKIVPQGP